jgi:hypothetical protein
MVHVKELLGMFDRSQLDGPTVALNFICGQVQPCKERVHPLESPSLVLVINDTKLLMPCVKWFELGISNTCDEGVCG